MVNSVTACSEAATALPGSTVRVSTTPSIGERIEALDRLVSSVDRAARAVGRRWRARWPRRPRRGPALARALSSSVAEGTLPPDRRATSSKRARLARASFSVAVALRQLGLNGRQCRARAQHLVVQLGGVQLHQHLAFLHTVVHIHQHPL